VSSSWYHRQPTLLSGRPLPAEQVYVARAASAGFFAAMSIALYALYVVRDAQLTPFQLVIVGAVLEGSTLLFEVPTGIVADALSRRLSILVGTVVFGLGPLCFGLFPSFEGIILGQLFFGIGYTFFSGALDAWLADEVGEEQAARVYPRAAQWRQGAAVAGILAGSALGFIDHSLPFIVGGAGYALLAIPLALTMTEAGYRPAQSGGRSVASHLASTARAGYAAATGSSSIRIAFLVTFFAGASSEAFDRLAGYHLLEDVGLPTGLDEVVLFGGMALLGQLGGLVLVRAVLGTTKDISRKALSGSLATLYLVIIVAFGAFALSSSFWLALLAALVVGWARAAEAPFFTAWVNRGLDSRTRATVLSSISQGNALGQLGAGPVFAVVAEAGGVVTALLLGALLVAPAIPLVRLRERERQDAE
jgi:DHA3 family tetracycline resistance protein-like MFS transporter